MSAAPAIAAGSPPPLPDGFPKQRLNVPADIANKIVEALKEAQKQAAEYTATHPHEELWRLASVALSKGKWPPKGEEEKAELARMHAIAKARTPDENVAAEWYASHGLSDGWMMLLKRYESMAGPEQAKRAIKLLDDVLAITNSASQIFKASANRQRPFDVDPTLPTSITRPGRNPSYPSGHTSAAWAAAVVLSFLMPDQAAQFEDLAMQASYARVYGGVHFPSDVIEGARLGAMIAMAMCADWQREQQASKQQRAA